MMAKKNDQEKGDGEQLGEYKSDEANTRNKQQSEIVTCRKVKHLP